METQERLIQLSMSQLRDIISEACAVGIRKYEHELRPTAKTINKSQAKQYLTRLGFQPSMLEKMIDNKLITPIKMGEARNSGVKFSSSRFFHAVDEIRLNRAINQNA